MLLFEAAAVRKVTYLTRLPDRVVVTSTSEFLFGLESRRLINDAQGILLRAVDVRGNEVLARYLDGSDGSEPVQDWADRMAPT